MVKVGIIGGSGLDNPELLQNYEEKEIDTAYGKPSSKIICGKLSGVEVCIISRHGKNHEIPPHKVNYRANIKALKDIGCTHIIASGAVGSLREEIKPGDIVFPDQFVDFTKKRINSFYDDIGEVKHLPASEPFSKQLREILIKTASELNIKHHNKATIAVIEGPRFSTRAESFFFKQFADIIGMTTVPECVLAKEAGIEYATIALSTDYDCWKQEEEPVTFEIVMQTMKDNAEKFKKILINALPRISEGKIDEKDKEFIKNKIRTIPNFPKPGIMFRDITTLLKDKDAMKKVIDILVSRYKDKNIEVVAAIESRGFILGAIIANKLNCSFVPIRKPGKLPAETLSQEYDLEYGKDKVEIHLDAINPGQKVLLTDDLLATGGTSEASANLIEKLGGKIEEIAFVIELTDLKGRQKLSNWNVFSIVDFKGE